MAWAFWSTCGISGEKRQAAQVAPRVFYSPETKELGSSLGLEAVGESTPPGSLILMQTKGALGLTEVGHGQSRGVQADLDRSRQTPKDDPLLRAIKLRPGDGLIVDATAGLGGDLAALIAAGHRVLAIERHPLLACLLEDGLARLQARGAGMQCELRAPAEAHTVLDSLKQVAVVYLDPMFPERKKKALPPKEAELLRRLIGPEPEKQALLTAARNAAPRVVVKRPLRAKPYAGVHPSGCIETKLVRFDLYCR